MENLYTKLEEYINSQISKLKLEEDRSIIELYDAIKQFLSVSKSSLNDLNPSIHAVICKELFGDNDNEINKYKTLCTYSSFLDNSYLAKEAQIVEYNKFYNIIASKLNKLLNSLETKIHKYQKQKEESLARISVYQEYLTLFNENGIIKSLEKEELNSFFEFLKSSTLEKEVILNLIIEFSKYNIEMHLKQEKKIFKNSEIEISRRSEKILEAISGNDIIKEEVNVSSYINIEELNEEERLILNQIDKILQQIKGVKGDSTLFELLEGEYSINGRSNIYLSVGSDKWKLIYDDIVKNLLPNFNKKRNEILEIFKFIIDEYEGKRPKQEFFELKTKEEVNIQYDNILEKEKDRINTFLQLHQKSRFNYDSYSEEEKRRIDIAYEYLKKDDKIGLNSLQMDISLLDIVFMKKLENLKYIIEELKFYLSQSEDEIIKYGIEDFNESVRNLSKELLVVLNNLEETYKKIKNQGFKNVEEFKEDKTSSDQENYIIFLNDDDDVPYIISKINSSESSDNIKDVYSTTELMTKVNYFNLVEKYNVKKVKPSRDKQVYRIRKNDDRISYIQVPISSENRDKICQKFQNSSKINILLVITVGFKHADSKNKNVYDEVNKLYEQNIEKINHIFDLFSTKFDQDTYKEAEKMILEGMETIKNIEKMSNSRTRKGAK